MNLFAWITLEQTVRASRVTIAAVAVACMMPGAVRAEWLDLDESTAVSSSVEKVELAPQNAFDDNTGTRWSSAHADNQWIYVDLGQDYTIQTVAIDWETAHSKDYQLLVRTSAQGVDTDPTNWTEIASVTGRTGVSGSGGATDDTFDFVTETFTAENGTADSSSVESTPMGRYLMMYGTTRVTVGEAQTQYGHSIFELDVEAIAVPEPSTFTLMCFGLFGAVAAVARKRRVSR